MKKLALVGSESKTRGNAPFDDPDYEIWILNEAAQQDWMKGRRWDVCFQLHKPEVYRSSTNWVARDHWQWLQAQTGKLIWMQDNDPAVPCSRRYPLEEIIESIPGLDMGWLQPSSRPFPWDGEGEKRRGWFDLSMGYALMLAIYLGYEDIEVYGMDLASNTEYTYQLGNWRFLVGIALGMGIRLAVKCSANDFGNGRLYGYDGEVQLGREYFEVRKWHLEKLWKDADRELHRLKDLANQAIMEQKYDLLATSILIDWQTKSMQAGEISGALSEAEGYEQRTDLITRQEFERRSAQAQMDGEGLRAKMYATGGKTEYVFNVWRQTGNGAALKQMRHFLGEQMRFAFDTGARLGIYRENIRYMTEYDDLLTAAGGNKSLAAVMGDLTA